MKLSQQNAFTLVEVLISILLLTIVLAAGISLYFNASAIMGKAMHKKIAMEIAMQKMEEIKAMEYSYIKDLPTGVWWPDISDDDSDITFGDFKAKWQRKITDDTGSYPHINKKVEIKISWINSDANNPTILNLATYIAP